MMIYTTWALRLFGLSGIVGALLFVSGDLSYHHVPGSRKSDPVKMSQLGESRLLMAGTLGLIGCWFYTFAALHIWIAFRPVGDRVALLIALAHAAVMMCYGMAHTAYFSIATGAKVAAQQGADVDGGGSLGNVFFQRLVTITYIPVAISSVLMFYGIVTGQSMYPRWMVVFLPIIMYVLKAPILRILPGRIREIVHDAYDNLIFLIFYVLSTIILWPGLAG